MVGLGALLLSVTMGCLSYFTVRHFLVSDQVSTARRQAYVIAAQVRNGLRSHTPLATVVDALYTPSGSNSIVYANGTWEAFYLGGKSSLPVALRALVVQGTPAEQTFDLAGSPAVAVGVPMPSVHADFFAVDSLSDLAHTLRVLQVTLIVVGVVTTVLGAAVGRWASGRSLRPLTAVSGAAVAIAQGQLDTRLPDVRDDPDLQGLTGSFNQMVDQLQERIEREARFTSDVSHELRSPLTTLVTSLDVLESDVDQLSPRARRALALLGADLRRFQRMVGDLLEISRADAGSADVVLEPVHADELVRRSVSARRDAETNGHVAQLEVAPQLAHMMLRVDKRRFERVMANLLENAELYGGGAVKVVAAPGPVRTDGIATLRVSVEDRGPGVPPGERQKIFERFYRGQAAGQRGAGTGSGLGLALVADHVNLHGGSAWVEGAEQGGARFVVELPAVVDDEEDL
jgi:two-component system, OmpR family, sensor histidine kinase MtrB